MLQLKQIFTKTFKSGVLFAAGVLTTGLFAVTISGTIHTFVSGDILDSAKMNQNFASLRADVESIDPPYSTGETLTHKRWIDGKPIYQKVINIGTIPAGGTFSSTAHGICTSGCTIDNVITITGFARNAAGTQFLPITVNQGSSNNIGVDITGSDIRIYATGTYASTSGFVIVEYTKN